MYVWKCICMLLFCNIYKMVTHTFPGVKFWDFRVMVRWWYLPETIIQGNLCIFIKQFDNVFFSVQNSLKYFHIGNWLISWSYILGRMNKGDMMENVCLLLWTRIKEESLGINSLAVLYSYLCRSTFNICINMTDEPSKKTRPFLITYISVNSYISFCENTFIWSSLYCLPIVTDARSGAVSWVVWTSVPSGTSTEQTFWLNKKKKITTFFCL